MYFFTDITTVASNYCLLHVNKYGDKRKFKKKLVFVDPGVHALMKGAEDYPDIGLLHTLAGGDLLDNEWISIDYPGDMFPSRMAEFIELTNKNNFKYAENPRYIHTVQFHLSNTDERKIHNQWMGSASGSLEDFASFKANFDLLAPLFMDTEKVLGLGNLCRIFHPNPLTDKIFDYVVGQSRGGFLTNHKRIKRVHVYGLGLRLIKKYVPGMEAAGIKVSTDSTKWTRAITRDLKFAHGVCCRKNTRDLYFTEYLKHIPGRVVY